MRNLRAELTFRWPCAKRCAVYLSIFDDDCRKLFTDRDWKSKWLDCIVFHASTEIIIELYAMCDRKNMDDNENRMKSNAACDRYYEMLEIKTKNISFTFLRCFLLIFFFFFLRCLLIFVLDESTQFEYKMSTVSNEVAAYRVLFISQMSQKRTNECRRRRCCARHALVCVAE